MQRDPRPGRLTRRRVRAKTWAARYHRDLGTEPHDMFHRRTEPAAKFNRALDPVGPARRAKPDAVRPDGQRRDPGSRIGGGQLDRWATGQVKLRARIDPASHDVAAADEARDERIEWAQMQRLGRPDLLHLA